MTDSIIFLLLFLFATCSQAPFNYSMRARRLKGLKNKTFGCHMAKVKDLNPKKIQFLKVFRKKHAT